MTILKALAVLAIIGYIVVIWKYLGIAAREDDDYPEEYWSCAGGCNHCDKDCEERIL